MRASGHRNGWRAAWVAGAVMAAALVGGCRATPRLPACHGPSEPINRTVPEVARARA